MPDRPTPGALEQRAATDAATPTIDGRRLRGVIPYGIESRDLGGFREVMEPGCLRGARLDDLVATVDHAGVPIGRHPRTLEVEDTAAGLLWSVELPESRSDVREAVERGDLQAGSWRMIVARDRWEGDVRHVEAVAELRDVSVVTNPAYSEARAEYRSAPAQPDPAPATPAAPEEHPVPDPPRGALRVENRSASTDETTIETRVLDGLRSVQKGESRSLTNTAVGRISPPDLSSYVWQKLRAASVVLASGIRVIPTDRAEVRFPRLTADVDPQWYAEMDLIVAGDPAFADLVATPKKLAHRVELSNEVIDDSEPSITELLDAHLHQMLALRLDRGMLEGNPASDPKSIRGLKYWAGIQSISMGTNGAALTTLDPFIRAIGLLHAANVPGPFAIVLHPRTWTELGLLKEAPTGSNVPLLATGEGVEEEPGPRILGTPVFASSQLSVTETKGTAANASSAYVYSTNPDAGPALVTRQDAEVELDRSRLFDRDASELRGKLRADFILANPSALVRIDGIIPPA